MNAEPRRERLRPFSMKANLTLWLDARLIRRAKAYAKRSGKSLSSIVADYFAALDTEAEEAPSHGAKVASLLGVMRGWEVEEGSGSARPPTAASRFRSS